MKMLNLYYFLIFLLTNFIVFCMELDTNFRQKIIDSLKENPDKITDILKEKKSWHSCFYMPTDIEIAEEAQRELTKDRQQIQSLDSQRLNQKIVDFSPYQIKLLNNDQLNDLSLKSISELKKNQLLALTEDRLAHILNRLSFLINYNNSESIKNSLIFINTTSENTNSGIIKKIISQIKKTILQNVAAERFNDISTALKNEDIIQTLEEHFDESLKSMLKDILTDHFLESPNNFDPNAIKHLNIGKIKPSDIPKLKPEHIQQLTSVQLKLLTDEQLKKLEEKHVKALNSEYILSLSDNQILKWLTSKKIDPALIQSLKPELIKKIEDLLVSLFDIEELQYVTDAQIQELSATTKFSLLKKLYSIFLHSQNPSIKKVIPSIIDRINNSITLLFPKNFKLYESVIKTLKSTFPDIKSFGILKNIDMEYIQSLTHEDFDLLEDDEKVDIYEKLNKDYQFLTQEQLPDIIKRYEPLEIKIFLLKLSKNTASYYPLFSFFNKKNLINNIKNLTFLDLKIIKESYFSEAILKEYFYNILCKYYKNSNFSEIESDYNDYSSAFIKVILMEIIKENKSESSGDILNMTDDEINTKKVIIDETQNIFHSPRKNNLSKESNSNSDSSTNPEKNSSLKDDDFNAKSLTESQVLSLDNNSYNKLTMDIKKHYENKNAITITDDVKLYKSQKLQRFIYALIRQKNNPNKTTGPKVLSSKTSLDSSFTSSEAAKSSFGNVQTSIEDSNKSLDESFFHRPQ